MPPHLPVEQGYSVARVTACPWDLSVYLDKQKWPNALKNYVFLDNEAGWSDARKVEPAVGRPM